MSAAVLLRPATRLGLKRIFLASRVNPKRAFAIDTATLHQRQKLEQQASWPAAVDSQSNSPRTDVPSAKDPQKQRVAISYREDFSSRHIGITKQDELKMLEKLGLKVRYGMKSDHPRDLADH